jgi:Ribbon-helix-helix protein, copG family
MRFLGGLRFACGPKSGGVPTPEPAASLSTPGCGPCAVPENARLADAICYVWYIQPVVKTTIYLPDELHRGIKHAAKERGTSEAELIRTAVRHELLGAPADQQERAQRRSRLLAAMGKLDSSAYPSGYLDELRAQWRG